MPFGKRFLTQFRGFYKQMNRELEASNQKRLVVKRLRRERRAFHSRLLGWGVSEREEGESKE